jgi:hypothetical protein
VWAALIELPREIVLRTIEEVDDTKYHFSVEVLPYDRFDKLLHLHLILWSAVA